MRCNTLKLFLKSKKERVNQQIYVINPTWVTQKAISTVKYIMKCKQPEDNFSSITALFHKIMYLKKCKCIADSVRCTWWQCWGWKCRVDWHNFLKKCSNCSKRMPKKWGQILKYLSFLKRKDWIFFDQINWLIMLMTGTWSLQLFWSGKLQN